MAAGEGADGEGQAPVASEQRAEGGIRFAGGAGVGYGFGMSELIFMVEEAPEGGLRGQNFLANV
jgi:hypothetical protein